MSQPYWSVQAKVGIAVALNICRTNRESKQRSDGECSFNPSTTWTALLAGQMHAQATMA